MSGTESSDIDVVARYAAERAGLGIEGPRRTELRKRIAGAIDTRGAGSGQRYRNLLERDPVEFEALVSTLIVGETYFFRHPRQLEFLRHEVLPARAAVRGSGELRLWSAGCAGGQEAYTLAFLAQEAGVPSLVRILGTDLSDRALEVARAGVYREWSLRSATPEQRDTYFEAVAGATKVKDRFRRAVTFRQHNLLDPCDDGACADMDLVMCRNVLIYLTADAVEQVGARLASALAPGGWLVTAPADPLLHVEGLEPAVTSSGIAYRRSAGATEVRASRRAGEGPRVTLGRVPPRPTEPVVQPARATASHGPVAATAQSAAVGADRQAQAHAVSLRALGNAGDVAGAMSAAEAAVAAFPLDPELRFLHSVLLLEAGRADEAVAAARGAVYLAPDLVVGHLALGRAEAARGDVASARRSFRNAARILRALPPETPVASAEGETAGSLLAAARAHDRALAGAAGQPRGQS